MTPLNFLLITAISCFILFDQQISTSCTKSHCGSGAVASNVRPARSNTSQFGFRGASSMSKQFHDTIKIIQIVDNFVATVTKLRNNRNGPENVQGIPAGSQQQVQNPSIQVVNAPFFLPSGITLQSQVEPLKPNNQPPAGQGIAGFPLQFVNSACIVGGVGCAGPAVAEAPTVNKPQEQQQLLINGIPQNFIIVNNE